MSRLNRVTNAYGNGPRIARRTGEIGALRKAAKQAGERFFAIGFPCRFGHMARRYVSTGYCIECHDAMVKKLRRGKPLSRKSPGTRRPTGAMRALGATLHAADAGQRSAIELERRRLNNIRHVHARRARKRGNGGAYTAEDIRALYRLQRGRCAACTVPLAGKYHQDHIVALSAGGSNSRTNIQLLCRRCNQHKQAKDPIAFMQARGYLL